MADPFRQFALTVKLLGLAHLDSVLVDVLQNLMQFLTLCLVIGVQTAGLVFPDSIDQLPQPQFHIVEVRNGLPERVRDVREHRLEVTESLAGIFGIFRIDSLVGVGVVDEHRNPPILAVFQAIGLRLLAHQHFNLLSFGLQRNEPQYLAVDVLRSFRFQFLTNMPGHGLDVALEQIHVREDRIVDPLKHVVWRIALSDNLVRVVDQPVAQRLYLLDLALDGEKLNYFLKICHS